MLWLKLSHYLCLGRPNDLLYLFLIYVHNFVVIMHLTYERRNAYIVQPEQPLVCKVHNYAIRLHRSVHANRCFIFFPTA